LGKSNIRWIGKDEDLDSQRAKLNLTNLGGMSNAQVQKFQLHL